ncbi:MAG: restriction endonuclease [Verrucomicrobiota bacterium]|jgi:hypothetical protein
MANPEPQLEAVLSRIRNPRNWADVKTIFQVIQSNPSLRGFVYGYVAEMEFERHYLKARKGIEGFSKDDDHHKTKSDRTVTFKGKPISIQVKSVQTNSIRFDGGRFMARVQNDASDRRRVTLPNQTKVETTCYVVGEYDILAVSLQPFTGKWRFAFKENSKLQRTTSGKYTAEQQRYLLATLETIHFPLDASWTEDFDAILEVVHRQKH